MAETWTNEGLDYLLTCVPGAPTGRVGQRDSGGVLQAALPTAFPATIYVGLFVNGGNVSSPSTVPATTAVVGTTPSGVTEATGTSYARQPAANSVWAAQVADGSSLGRKSIASQLTMATVGSGGWGTIQGFFFTIGSTPSAAGVGLWYANFDDVTSIVSAQGDIIKITPTWQFNY